MKRLLLIAFLASCGGKVTKAPPPFRPKPTGEDVAKAPPPPEKTDCDPNPRGLGAMPYIQRSLDEAEDLASASLRDLQAAETPGVDPGERERLITAAVEGFIRALLADPYNVNATYNLAAAYARIDRPQCSINMLDRLIQMRTHASKRDQVEAKLDRLLGRKKQTLDPDFRDMRGDPRFRELIRDLCGNSEDPGCVR